MNQIARPRPRVPAHIEPYVEVLGVDLAVTFLLQFGGSEVYFPSYGNQDDRGGEPVTLVGLQAMHDLRDRLGMGKMRIPLGNSWIAQHLAWQGHSVAAIARRVRVTDNAVRGYLKKAQEHERAGCESEMRRFHI